MKKIFTSPDPGDIALVKSLLEAEEIKYTIKNEYFQGMLLGNAWPEIWVLHPEQFAQAEQIIQSYTVQDNDIDE